jgi:hypothetical protein
MRRQICDLTSDNRHVSSVNFPTWGVKISCRGWSQECVHVSDLSVRHYLRGPCRHRPQGVVLTGSSTQAVLVQEQFEVVLRLPLA